MKISDQGSQLALRQHYILPPSRLWDAEVTYIPNRFALRNLPQRTGNLVRRFPSAGIGVNLYPHRCPDFACASTVIKTPEWKLCGDGPVAGSGRSLLTLGHIAGRKFP